MGFKILKGKETLNDFLCFELSLNNFFNFELSIMGYGFRIEYMIYDSISKTVEGVDL